MNKKGFTLIEVLSVLVLLGIISAITVPTVNKIIKNAKNKLYDEQVAQIISASKKWGTDNIDAVGLEDDNVFISINDLKKSGYLEKNDVIDPRSNEEMNGCVMATFIESKKQYTYKYYEMSCVELTEMNL